MEVAPGIYAYRGRSGEKIKPGAGSSAVTIVRGDTSVMIDTGVVRGGALFELKEGVVGDGLDLSGVEWILVTHSHWDHLNAAGLLVSEYGMKVGAPVEELPCVIDGKRNFNAFLSDFGEFTREVFPFPLFFARLLLWYAWGAQPRLTVDRSVSDADVIDIGRKIHAVALPGHTDGHTGYFIPDAGVLVCGDLIDFENSQGMDLNNPRSNYRSALESLKRALALEPEVIIPGHGEVVVGRKESRAMLERALSGGMEYPELVLDTVTAKPSRLKKITYAVFPDIPFSVEAMTMMLVLQVLFFLEEEKRVTRVRKAGRPAWVRVD
jgi:glyoxylase-like metal-dependent hydrolase (beta-lactamase superfamily II)